MISLLVMGLLGLGLGVVFGCWWERRGTATLRKAAQDVIDAAERTLPPKSAA